MCRWPPPSPTPRASSRSRQRPSALVALLGCIALALSLRRLRRAQRLVLGEHDAARRGRSRRRHAGRLRGAARPYVDDDGQRLDGRLAGVEAALRGTIAHRALVRYDAYNELSGHQSVSIALLDDEQSGIVLSCIHHRDQARVYAKQMHGGRGELELSPEEAEAVRPSRPRAGDVTGIREMLRPTGAASTTRR